MSNTTVSMRSAAEDARLRELRDREAKAREAARRRIGVANAAIARSEERFRLAVQKLDEACARLPDLELRVPQLAGISASDAQDPARVEAFAAAIDARVDQFGAELERAIEQAEHLLRRRLRVAAAWRAAKDLEDHLRELAAQCAQNAQALREAVPGMRILERPQADAEAEVVETYVSSLRPLHDEWLRKCDSLRSRVEALRRAQGLGGSRVRAGTAAQALAAHDARQHAEKRAAFDRNLQRALDINALRIEALPQGLRARVEMARAESHERESSQEIGVWLARHKRQESDAQCAQAFMKSPPEGVREEPGLSQRWTALCGQLQRVAAGLDELSPSHELEVRQLRLDAQRAVNLAFSRADWVRALNEQGFEVLEREDGEGLVVVDLDHSEAWLEVQQHTTEDGSFVASLELKTDVAPFAGEDRVTDAICAKLERVAESAASGVASGSEVVEHETRITRARRPRAFAQGM